MLPIPGPGASWAERRAFCQPFIQEFIKSGLSPEQALEKAQGMGAFPPYDDQAERIEGKRQAAIEAIEIDGYMGNTSLYRRARDFVFLTYYPKPDNHTDAVVAEALFDDATAPYSQYGRIWPTAELERLERAYGHNGEEFPSDQPDGSRWTTSAWKEAVLGAIESDETPSSGT